MKKINLKIKNNLRGFTLIEVVIYLALFSIIMGGLLVTVYQLAQSAETLQTKSIKDEEMNFVLKKLDWALTGAKSSTVSITNSNAQLTFTRTDQIITINLSGTNDIEMSVAGTTQTLTTKNVKITNLNFNYDNAKKIISVSFIMNGKIANFTKYLKI